MLYASVIKLKALPKHTKTMKRTLRSLLLPVLTSMLFATAQAQQVVTYTCTGTKTSGDAFFGATVTGTITVDLAAQAQIPPNTPGEWRNYPNFKITAQATNFSGGTGTSLDVDDTIYRDSSLAKEFSWFGVDFAPDGSSTGKNIILCSTSTQSGVSDPKNDTNISLLLNESFYDQFGGGPTYNSYYSVTITAVTTNIIIDGKDTGIKDFSYKGQAVSAILASYASSAKNHGDYVESVEKLAEKLVKAKLLTKAQAKTLTQAAEKSSIGQKPKKDKEDKDDKGKGGKDKDDD